MLASSPEEYDRIVELFGDAAAKSIGFVPIPEGWKLSVVIPAFNEVKTIEEVIRRVAASGVPTEIIVVDDASSDGTRELLEAKKEELGIQLLSHEKNRGKGAALRSGFTHATGDCVIVQDADCEYDPAEFCRLVGPILDGRADVVYGSRFAGETHRVLYFWHSLGNKFLTFLSNMFTNLNLTDMETCYKLFRREVIQAIAPDLKESRFGIEPEITAKIAAIPGIRIYEMPISYDGRTYEEGKKIGWRDGVSALRCIVRYGIAKRPRAPIPPSSTSDSERP